MELKIQSHRYDQRHGTYQARMRARPVQKLVLQKNNCQLHDFPIEGPHPWMWYCYDKRAPMPVTANGPWVSAEGWGCDRFYYMRTRTGVMAMGRNLEQALRNYRLMIQNPKLY